MAAWPAARAALALPALLLGGALGSAPQAIGGPMNLDFSNPLGAVLLLAGAALLPDPADRGRRLFWLLGGALAAAPALRHLALFPPFSDGQRYANYSGVPDPDIWPAGSGFTALALVPLALSLAAPPAPGAATATKWALLLRAVPAAAALGWGFAAFNGALWWLAGSEAIRPAVLAGGGAAVMAGLGWRHRLLARVSGAHGAVLLGLCGLMLWLEAR